MPMKIESKSNVVERPSVQAGDGATKSLAVSADETDERNRELVTRLFEEALPRGQLTPIDDLVSPGYQGHTTGMVPQVGPQGFKRFITRLRRAIYRLSVTVDDIRGDGVWLTVDWTATGNLERPFMGIEPTLNVGDVGTEPAGNPVTVSGRSSLLIRNGKVQECWTHLRPDVGIVLRRCLK